MRALSLRGALAFETGVERGGFNPLQRLSTEVCAADGNTTHAV
jgi:hypothetical protein